MKPFLARSGWAGTFVVLSSLVLASLTGCASLPYQQTDLAPRPVIAPTPASEEDDWSQLKAQMRVDLNRYTSREIARTPVGAPVTATAQARDREFAAKANAMFAPLARVPL